MSALRLFDKFAKLLDVSWGSIADGQTLMRTGSNIVGYTPGAGSGDVVGPASAVDSEVTLFSGTGGKTIKRATGTGLVNVVGGVYQTPIDASAVTPVGIVMDFAGSTEPTGWIFCYGQSLLRAGTYAALFAVIGTTYGNVDGTHFNAPDLRGRVVAGKDNMGGSAANRLQTAWGVNGATLGASGGAQSHTLTVAQLAAHTHGAEVASGGQVLAAGGNYNLTYGVGGTSAGGDAAHHNVQPTLVLNKIIKY